MMRHHRTWIALPTLFIAGMFSSCSCEKDPLGSEKPGTCDPTFKCKAGFDYRLGVCKASRCVVDSDCCPGQKCNAAAGFCADQFVACTDDSNCTEVAGQTCIDFRGGKFCGYPNKGNALSTHGTQSCMTNADCDNGRTCFGSRCVFNAPCMGGCPAGSICDVDSNTCFDKTDCTMQCGAGQILVVADPDTESGAHCCKVDCKCETLPPIHAGQIGWYASLGIRKSEVVVSAYDTTYGDLVLAHFGLDAKPAMIEYIDGFPSSGAIVANPNGPRGGRIDPGEDVGQHTSLAVDSSDNVHIAYYDKTNGHLKYANNVGGKWNISIVDQDGNSGQYTSLVIGPDGNPRISYMMVEGTMSPDPTKITALKYAAAHTANPASPSDWAVQVLETKPLPIPPCNGSCPMGQACIDMGMGPACTTTEMGCNMPMCASNEACVDVAGTPTCKTTIPLLAIDDLIPGVGLFSSLAFSSTGTPVIAYYDRLDKDLRLAKGRPDGTFGLTTLDGGDPMNPSDVGQHVSLAVGPMDVLGLAYVDFNRDNLVYMEFAGGQKSREIVDNGVTAPDIRMVGPDASLIYDANGSPAIAYQDPTLIDLLYARRLGAPPMWSTEVLRGGPMMGMMSTGMASGFYASQKRLDTKAYVSNVDATFDTEGNLVLTLSVVIKTLN
jgi:hypothetical protein